MTIQVKIEHKNPHYDRSVVVDVVRRDRETGALGLVPTNSVEIKPGQSAELYVHLDCALVVREVG